MKRLHCIVEGQTEVKVFYSILNPYIYDKTGAHIDFTPIKHTGGGIVKFSKIFKELRNHLSDNGKIVTTFLDYYGINANHNFNNYSDAKINQNNPHVGAALLEHPRQLLRPRALAASRSSSDLISTICVCCQQAYHSV